ncbi:putative nucleotide-binding alpha-beta plait domain superfamily, RNA-binding domain superfamily [Helianthus annuus]|nr:putative nucleotide-binding alpha-beta plait domain superfamily, RNA-binding domain superfamily [Helianthus annuus]
MAALLRFVCFPSSSSSSSIFSSSNQQQFFINPINPKPSSSLQSLSLSVSLPNRPQRPNLLIFPTQSAVESPPVDNPTQQSEEEQEDEGSRTRLLAQNVPWTCTADDIRPLFEKYGTVGFV